MCAAVVLGYFVGRRSSPRREQAPKNLANQRAKVAPEEQPSTTKESVEPKLIKDVTPRLPSPRAAALEWVEDMRHGDVEAVARSIVLTSEARSVIEKTMASAPPDFTRKYPTPELLTAFVFCGAQKIVGFQIETEKSVRSDYSVLEIAFKFESESEWRREGFGFERTPDGWKNVVDRTLATRIAAIVSAPKR